VAVTWEGEGGRAEGRKEGPKLPILGLAGATRSKHVVGWSAVTCTLGGSAATSAGRGARFDPGPGNPSPSEAAVKTTSSQHGGQEGRRETASAAADVERCKW
jgi:hypothetical protein